MHDDLRRSDSEDSSLWKIRVIDHPSTQCKSYAGRRVLEVSVHIAVTECVNSVNCRQSDLFDAEHLYRIRRRVEREVAPTRILPETHLR